MLSLKNIQLDSAGDDSYKNESFRRRKSRRYENDLPSSSTNDMNSIRRSQVLTNPFFVLN